jgi:hypothetical protein
MLRHQHRMHGLGVSEENHALGSQAKDRHIAIGPADLAQKVQGMAAKR